MKGIIAALLASVCVAGVAQAQSVEAKRFGAREIVREVSISPDGQRIAMIVTSGTRGTGLVVATTAGDMKPLMNYPGSDARLASCAWSTNSRLVCTVFGIAERNAHLVGISRMIALNADGSGSKELSAAQASSQLYERYYGGGVLDWLPDDSGSAVLMLREFVPEYGTGTLVAQTRKGLGVERVDTITLKRTTVEAPRATGADFITDGHGLTRVMATQPRLGSGYSSSDLVYKYRRKDSKEWEPLSTVTYTGYLSSGFIPYAVDRDLDVVYGFDNADGRTALFKIALDGSLKRELVLANPEVDVDALIRIGRQQRVVGASFSTERRQVSYFDPQIRALAASLGKALPGLPIVGVGDASLDEKKLVIFAGSDVDPGHYYLLDRTTKKMAEISPVRPDLAGVPLATVKAIRYKAADGTEVPAYLTLPPGSDGKNIPAIVMPHGGPSARDEWGFDWLSQFFASRGYAVLQPNYRGSSGYGEGWFKQNGFRSWKLAMGDVNDAGRWMVAQGITSADKLAIVGWSYGGYAALQSSVLDPTVFKAIAAVAPVTDLGQLRDELKRSSSDQQVQDIIGDPKLWEEASPAQHADRIAAPVLLFHGDRDLNVAIGQSRTMASKLRGAGRSVEFTEYKGLDHQLDDSAVRTAMLDRIDQFLRTTMKLPAKP
ncbi:alpha/beta hydrolase family protein [Sphingomonas hengshuiensis]|uniref:Peptidase S9 n=1 Tax=Sphingomonas hengshuiensis TaxID=1609977 RepID=A0A7U4LH05_9SPHN|nr:S9 family peptidase [Sphingomonas hengshuiensis]AJP73858.1 peptidase S9 [Sphingomonas hengshuiensis]